MKNEQKIPKRSKRDYFAMSHSLLLNHLQTEVKKSKRKPKFAKITDYLTKRLFSWLYYYVVNRFGPKHRFTRYPGNMTGIYDIGSEQAARICLAADWATFTEEADSVANAIRDLSPDYTIHLGDTYYVGTPEEIGANFLLKNAPWVKGSKGSFALMGNHEMYARGIAYFRDLLPEMGIIANGRNIGQHAAYFCLENAYWRILGLDTGYHSTGKVPLIEMIPSFAPDCRLHESLVDWLNEVVRLGNPDDKRGLVILTHHQFVTAFSNESEYTVASKQLAALIGDQRPVIWLFGHEHKFSIYEKVHVKDGVTAYGRCIGHGGMPIEVGSRTYERNKRKSGYNKLVAVDERVRAQTESLQLGYNGFADISVHGQQLQISYHDVNEKLLMETWLADPYSGAISGSITAYSKGLIPESGKMWKDAVK